jgi:hypothetical protein
MKTNFTAAFLGVLASGFFLLTACSGPTAIPTITPTSTTVVTPSSVPTATPFSSPTSRPVQTSLPDATALPAPAVSSTLDPGPGFPQARVIRHGQTGHWNYFVTLQADSAINGDYYAMVDQNKEYTCHISSKMPRQMTCMGPMAAFEDYIDFWVYAKGGTEPVFKAHLYIAAD